MSVGIFITGSLVTLQIMMGNDVLLSARYRNGGFISTQAPRPRGKPSTFNAPNIPEKQVENLVAGFLDSLSERPAKTKRYASANLLVLVFFKSLWLSRTYEHPPVFLFRLACFSW